MQLCKLQLESGEVRVGIVADDHVRLLTGISSLSGLLYTWRPSEMAPDLIDPRYQELPLEDVTLSAPIDQQEVWAAGVTYKRSQEARERESEGAARFYDLVYSAARPELFFKANPHRVVGPAGRVHIRRDSKWSVPEPELALVISPQLQIVGYTIGNDMSSRDIEGTNPLYLPQAKVYDRSCALGPGLLIRNEPMPATTQIKLDILRSNQITFSGTTTLAELKRNPATLVEYLFRDQSFPHGCFLLTGTGIVPPDSFTLAGNDEIQITIDGIGTLTNKVE
jgi:2-dehydro-3-deoxy-D-arabinonate dehydratase